MAEKAHANRQDPAVLYEEASRLTNEQLMKLLYGESIEHELSDSWLAEDADMSSVLSVIDMRREADPWFSVAVEYNRPLTDVVARFRDVQSGSRFYEHSLEHRHLEEAPRWRNRTTAPSSGARVLWMRIRSVWTIAEQLGSDGSVDGVPEPDLLTFLENQGERPVTGRELIYLYLQAERERRHFAFLTEVYGSPVPQLETSVTAPGTVIREEDESGVKAVPSIGTRTGPRGLEMMLGDYDIPGYWPEASFVATVAQ